MFTAAINLSFTDVVVLLLLATALGFVVHFVITNKKKLQKMLDESNQQISLTGSGDAYAAVSEVTPYISTEKPPVKKRDVFVDYDLAPAKQKAAPAPVKPAAPARDETAVDVLCDLKENIQQQQKSLDVLLEQVDHWYKRETESVPKEEVEALEIMLEKRELELHNTKQQLAAAQKRAARIDDVYKEFDDLQEKITSLETTARQANELAMELDDIKQSHVQLKKDLQRKQEKLADVVAENGRLHHQLSETEDKLDEANLQRQQLFKKVQFLENMNTELQQMSDAHKKLQNELRRIGELESMLSMVSDERDLLLKKKNIVKRFGIFLHLCNMNPSVADIRKEYATQVLLEENSALNPLDQFTTWWQQALNSQLDEINAMTLATASADGMPSARIVLLKGFDTKGFVFYTNYNSYKGLQLAENPKACLVFFWKELERQVRITGLVVPVAAEESTAYFMSRPQGSQLGAWASPQSTVIPNRQWLDENYLHTIQHWADKRIERPPHWGGYRVQPVIMEFWQGRPSRLHDRLQYTLEENGSWKRERLAP